MVIGPKGKFGGGGRDKGGRDRDKGGRDKGDRDGRSGGGPSHRQYATSASPRERDRPADPNSPFANWRRCANSSPLIVRTNPKRFKRSGYRFASKKTRQK